ncbi:MAG: extracellular solute-binding protein, partial [Acidimicrobiia bacterium]|nr:extracellular solute-binding protein [Acidimicrobiia bacterium]
DLFFSQDPASIGAVANAGLLTTLDAVDLARVPAQFSDVDGRWVGVSGRSRVMVYNTSAVAGDLPVSVDAIRSDEWAGRVAIAPTNGSFLAFVAAMILLEGEDVTLRWLEAMESAPTYSGNSVIVAAVANGEVDAGLVNHYYLLRLMDEQGGADAANWFFPTSGAGSLVMPSGAGILASSGRSDAAAEFVEFLLSDEAQRYFADETFEYPLVPAIEANSALPPLQSLQQPDIDLSELADVLDLATDLVARAGLL